MANKSNPNSKQGPRQPKPGALTAGRNNRVNERPGHHNASRTRPIRFFLRSGSLFRVAGQHKK